MDKCLPLGFCSAPIFTCFFEITSSTPFTTLMTFSLLVQTWEGCRPSPVLVFLGIKLDTVQMRLTSRKKFTILLAELQLGVQPPPFIRPLVHKAPTAISLIGKLHGLWSKVITSSFVGYWTWHSLWIDLTWFLSDIEANAACWLYENYANIIKFQVLLAKTAMKSPSNFHVTSSCPWLIYIELICLLVPPQNRCKSSWRALLVTSCISCLACEEESCLSSRYRTHAWVWMSGL